MPGSPELRVLALGVTLAAGTAALLRAGGDARPDAADTRPAISIDAAALARLRAAREREAGVGARSAAEERAVREQAIDEEVLYREALAHADADGRDPAVRRRLLVLASGLASDSVGEGRDLEAEARRLGLDRNDVVLRRYLIESMRLALSRPARAEEPSEAEVRRAYERDAQRYTAPPELVLTHVYLSRERRGDATPADAARLAERLRREALGPDEAARLGDPFARGAAARGSAADLDRAFGAGFGRALDGQPVGAWLGPIESAFGLHLVWIRERIPGRRLPLEQVRGQVVQTLLAEKGEELLRARLAALRARYRVEPTDVASR